MKEITMDPEEDVLDNFAFRIQKKMNAAGIPQKLFGADLVTLLLGFAVEFFQGCLQGRSANSVASSIQRPLRIHEFIFRRRLARKVFRGSKNYEENRGDEIVTALFDTCSESHHEDLVKLVDHISENGIPDDNPDVIPVVFTSL